MKGIRFYEEFGESKRRGSKRRQSEGNVIATFLENRFGDAIECLSAVYFHNDSPVASGAVALDYLREKCVRVSEAHARQVHPTLFGRLDGAS